MDEKTPIGLYGQGLAPFFKEIFKLIPVQDIQAAWKKMIEEVPPQGNEKTRQRQLKQFITGILDKEKADQLIFKSETGHLYLQGETIPDHKADFEEILEKLSSKKTNTSKAQGMEEIIEELKREEQKKQEEVEKKQKFFKWLAEETTRLCYEMVAVGRIKPTQNWKDVIIIAEHPETQLKAVFIKTSIFTKEDKTLTCDVMVNGKKMTSKNPECFVGFDGEPIIRTNVVTAQKEAYTVRALPVVNGTYFRSFLTKSKRYLGDKYAECFCIENEKITSINLDTYNAFLANLASGKTEK